MKINQIPDIYIEQYIIGELPENLRKQINELAAQNSELNNRIIKIRESNKEILSSYPAETMVQRIVEKSDIRKNISADASFVKESRNKTPQGIITGFTDSLNNIIKKISSISARRYTLSIASAAAMILVFIFMIPGIRTTDNTKIPYENDVRIKGLESKLLLFRMKGKEIEELRNMDAARSGDIIQVAYIAAGDYKHGVILSIDGRGTVTLHLPDGSSSGDKLILNRKVLLNKSYELDDSPSFERFIMILSTDPINASDIIEKAKKLANSRESAVNGLIGADKGSIEFSITIKKTE